jgi:hypothetical protein
LAETEDWDLGVWPVTFEGVVNIDDYRAVEVSGWAVA